MMDIFTPESLIALLTLTSLELVQGGQLLLINTNAASATLEDGVLIVQGAINDDEIFVDESGKYLAVYVIGDLPSQFRKSSVRLIDVHAGASDDLLNDAVAPPTRPVAFLVPTGTMSTTSGCRTEPKGGSDK